MKRVLVVMAGLVLVALLSVDIYLRLQPSRNVPAPTPAPPSPSPTMMAAPTPVATAAAEPTPSPTPEVAVVEVPVAPAAPDGTKPRPRPGRPPARRTPRPAIPPTASAATLLAEADRAMAAKDYSRAAQLYEQVLALEPANPRAASGRALAAGELSSRRTFVAGETTFATGDGSPDSASAGAVPRGFDPGGVAVRTAPKIPASIEFDVTPKKLKAGDPYTVRIYVRNQGKKPIKIRELRVASTLNGTRSEAAITPRLKDVPPELSALVAEIPSVWKADVKAWTMEVAVRSAHGDLYKNAVSWR
jgi:hypothetical protein